MAEETLQFIKVAVPETNTEKSMTSSAVWDEILEGSQGYSYLGLLGIIEACRYRRALIGLRRNRCYRCAQSATLN